MSKYVVLIKYKKNNHYSGMGHLPYYCLLFHTDTKYPENYPYFSATVTEKAVAKHSVDKSEIDALFKMAKTLKVYNSEIVSSKKGKIFILKANSSKLKEIIAIN